MLEVPPYLFLKFQKQFRHEILWNLEKVIFCKVSRVTLHIRQVMDQYLL